MPQVLSEQRPEKDNHSNMGTCPINLPLCGGTNSERDTPQATTSSKIRLHSTLHLCQVIVLRFSLCYLSFLCSVLVLIDICLSLCKSFLSFCLLWVGPLQKNISPRLVNSKTKCETKSSQNTPKTSPKMLSRAQPPRAFSVAVFHSFAPAISNTTSQRESAGMARLSLTSLVYGMDGLCCCYCQLSSSLPCWLCSSYGSSAFQVKSSGKTEIDCLQPLERSSETLTLGIDLCRNDQTTIALFVHFVSLSGAASSSSLP